MKKSIAVFFACTLFSIVASIPALGGVYKSTNGGQSWSVISPDLSTHNPSRIVSSGGLIGDNLGQFYCEVVFAIAPSTVKRGLIWAGTNDGKLWYTSDGGGHWNDVSANMHIPTWGERPQRRTENKFRQGVDDFAAHLGELV